MKYPIAAELTADTPTYGTGFVIGKAIAAKVAMSGGDANVLFADDVASESDTAFSGGTIELGVDDLADAIQAKLLGHSIVGGVIKHNANDSAINVGQGYYRTRIKNGVKSYRATWLYKVKYSEPDEEAATKGDKIEWQTPTIKGNIVALPNGDWKDQKTFDSESDAIAWLENLANIGQPTTKTALNADIVTAEATAPETYTSATYALLYLALQNAKAVAANQDATQTEVDAAEDDLEAAIAGLIAA